MNHLFSSNVLNDLLEVDWKDLLTEAFHVFPTKDHQLIFSASHHNMRMAV